MRVNAGLLSIGIAAGVFSTVGCRGSSDDVASGPTGPDKALARTERNQESAVAKLGEERSSLIRDVSGFVQRQANAEPNYSGYALEYVEQERSTLWPLGKSDEVLVLIESKKLDNTLALLTCWRRIDGQAKRMWKVRLEAANRRSLEINRGTLARWLHRHKCSFPANLPKDVEERLGRHEDLAVYREVPLNCELQVLVLHSDLTESDIVSQDLSEVPQEAMAIAPEEAKALKARQKT